VFTRENIETQEKEGTVDLFKSIEVGFWIIIVIVAVLEVIGFIAVASFVRGILVDAWSVESVIAKVVCIVLAILATSLISMIFWWGLPFVGFVVIITFFIGMIT